VLIAFAMLCVGATVLFLGIVPALVRWRIRGTP
jgi:membrane protein YdbS with pleckstrin-like domain